MKICVQCHAEFDPVNERPSHPAKFCSRKCRDDARTTRVQLVCVQCHQPFRRKAYMAEWSRERGPFCCFACYGQWQSDHCTGPENPTYSQESVRRDSWNWKHARRLALCRDQGRCSQCGSKNRLHVHHLNGADNHELGNLATLCASCHRKRHPVAHAQDGRFSSTP